MNTSISKEISERDKVIIGADGWLFLTNDSNNSVAQFVGEISHNSRDLEKFSSYIKALKDKISCDFFFSIAPNKEFVIPEKYPFRIKEKGTTLIHEQVISMLGEHNVTYHYPVEELASIPDSFYKTDTHWSEYGAYKTIKSFFRSSFDTDLIELESTDFFIEYVSGDLGSKLDGREDGRLSYSFTISKYEVFNSGLKSNGFGSHYINLEAQDQRKVLVFGDSFGVSYIEPLVLTFREVVFIYSPAAFIEDVYTKFSPDFVVLQVNQRFLFNLPRYRRKLEDSPVFRKFRQFNCHELEHYVHTRKEKFKYKPSFLNTLYFDGLAALSSSSFPPQQPNNDVSHWAKKRAFLITKEMVFDNSSVEVSHVDISPVFKSYCAELIKINCIDEAISIATEYCQKYPNISFSHDLLSYVHWKTKNYESALIEGKIALRLNRQNTTLRISVVRLHLALNQTEEASYHLDVILGFPFRDKKAWIALYKDMSRLGVSLDMRLKVLNKIKEIDSFFEM